jgi:hypothetical protein
VSTMNELAPIALWHKEEMATACKHAKEVGQMESFRFCINRLRTIAKNYNGYVSMAKDFAPYSFGFAICQLKDFDGNPVEAKGDIIDMINTDRYNVQSFLIGGMIYHGATKGEEVNNYTATFDAKSGWSLHT